MHISELTHYIPTKKCLSYHAKKCDGLTDGLSVNLSSPDSQFKNKKKTCASDHVNCLAVMHIACCKHRELLHIFSYVI